MGNVAAKIQQSMAIEESENIYEKVIYFPFYADDVDF